MKNLIIVTLLLVASPAFADLTDTVRCREIAFSKSVENRDAEAFRAFIDKDARFIGGHVRRGRSEITEGWAPLLAEGGPRIKWRPIFVEVLDDGKLALTRGLYRLISEHEDGSETVSWGSFNSTWRLNDDGEWRVVFDAGDAAAEPPSLEDQFILEQDDDCP